MKNTTLKLVSGGLLVFLGVCHQTVHFLFELNPDKPKIALEMMAHEIEMMGEHTLMEFHTGFSFMTGHFLISLGVIIIVIRKIHERNLDVTILLGTISICMISILYFHVLAYGVSGLAAICYLKAMMQKKVV